MTDEKPAGVPTFEIGGAVFTCFVAAHKDGTTYVWRSACNGLAVGRIGHKVWARIDGTLIGDDLGGLKTAMGIAALRLTAQQVAA